MGVALATVLAVPQQGLAQSRASAPALPVALSVCTPQVDCPPESQPAVGTPQSILDGCQRDPGALLTKNSPEWAYVYNTPSTQPAPPRRTVVGTIRAFNPKYAPVHTSGGDLPMGHGGYDFNVNVLPDPAYAYLMAGHKDVAHPDQSTGNYSGGGEETERLHTEWEDVAVPKFAWGSDGDRITEVGRWVWDCGHWGPPTEVNNPDYILPKVGAPCGFGGNPDQCTPTGEGSEFHPYVALWLERASSPNSAAGESEGDLFISTNETKAGIEADCAHQNPPLTPTSAYPPSYAACLDTAMNWQDITGNYSFLLPAPPKPSPTAVLTYRSVDNGSTNGVPPTLTPEGDGVRVTLAVSSPTAGVAQQVAYQVFAGWSEPPTAGPPTHLHVTLDQLVVHKAMDPGCATQAFGAPGPCPDPLPSETTRNNQESTSPGDWNMYWDVNGIWGQWQPTGQATQEFLPADGTSYTGTQSIELYVPQGQGWNFFVHGRECDLGSLFAASQGVQVDCPNNTQEIADNNDVQGLILDKWASAADSLGTHSSNGKTNKDDPTSTCPDINTNGCYTLTYTVSLVQPEVAIPEVPLVPLLLLAAGAAEVARRRLRAPSRLHQ